MHPWQLVDQLNEAPRERSQHNFGENRVAHEALQGLHEANNAGQILRSGPALILMTSAEQNRSRLQGRPDKQRARAFRAMNLVGTDGNLIGVELVDIRKRLLAEPLDGIRVEQDAVLLAKRA